MLRTEQFVKHQSPPPPPNFICRKPTIVDKYANGLDQGRIGVPRQVRACGAVRPTWLCVAAVGHILSGERRCDTAGRKTYQVAQRPVVL